MKILILLLLSITIYIFPQGWAVNGEMPNPVAGGQAFVKGDTIYIMGGYSDNLNSVVDLIQAYDPKTNRWSIAGHMKYHRSAFAVGVVSDSIVYFGGIDSLPYSFVPASMEVWNFKSSPYIFKRDTSFSRSFTTSQFVNGNLYTFGGISMNTNFQYLFGYNFESDNTINTDDSISTPHLSFDQMSAIVGNDIYIFGGTSSLAPLRTIYKFNTFDKTLVDTHADLERTRAGGAAVAIDSVIYLIGGYDQTSPTAIKGVSKIDLRRHEVEEESMPSLNFARKYPMAVNYNGSIYVFGGLDQNGQVVTQIEKLDAITDIKAQTNTLPSHFELENNYPNPFNPTTQIAFKVGITAQVTLDIYSILGEHIKSVVNIVFSPGEYTYTWNGTDDAGGNVASGVYIYRLTSGYFTDSKKMLLLK